MGIILNLRDLQRLERRIGRIQREQAPPTLKMVVINEEPDEDGNPMDKNMADLVNKYDPWTMVINVEKKPKNWGK